MTEITKILKGIYGIDGIDNEKPYQHGGTGKETWNNQGRTMQMKIT